MKNQIKIVDNQYVMDFWILPTFFVTLAKLMDIQTFILQCVNLICLKLWDIGWIMFKKLKIHWIWNVILIYYVMDFLKSQKL
jgi:hypothetical protein